MMQSKRKRIVCIFILNIKKAYDSVNKACGIGLTVVYYTWHSIATVLKRAQKITGAGTKITIS